MRGLRCGGPSGINSALETQWWRTRCTRWSIQLHCEGGRCGKLKDGHVTTPLVNAGPGGVRSDGLNDELNVLAGEPGSGLILSCCNAVYVGPALIL